MFLSKKIIGSLFLPLPITLLLLLAGMLILCCTEKRRLAILLFGLAIVLLLLFSTRALPAALLAHLENQYTPLKHFPKKIDTIVVLGAGSRWRKNEPPNTQLPAASLARLVEGLRLYRLCQRAHQNIHQNTHKDCHLILSGGRIFGPAMTAGVMRNTALVFGANRRDITIASGARDTAAEAKHMHAILGKRPFVLVTSALHMPRALLLFKRYNMHPIPAPTQFLSTRARHFDPRQYFPRTRYLINSDSCLHEYIGLLWERISA